MLWYFIPIAFECQSRKVKNPHWYIKRLIRKTKIFSGGFDDVYIPQALIEDKRKALEVMRVSRKINKALKERKRVL
jgi:hypothetical protein